MLALRELSLIISILGVSLLLILSDMRYEDIEGVVTSQKRNTVSLDSYDEELSCKCTLPQILGKKVRIIALNNSIEVLEVIDD